MPRNDDEVRFGWKEGDLKIVKSAAKDGPRKELMVKLLALKR